MTTARYAGSIIASIPASREKLFSCSLEHRLYSGGPATAVVQY